MATSHSSQKSKQRAASPESFLEALRGLKNDFTQEAKVQVKKIVTTDIPESFGLSQSSGTLNPNESFSVRDQVQEAETRGYEQASGEFQQRLIQIREQERQTFLREEATKKEEVKVILEQIRGFASSVAQFKQEVEIAAMQAPVHPGLYHKHFFYHLKTFISALKARVESSRHWLATTNGRAKKQGYYWNQVGKSGTSYMLSSERYMVTSTG